MRPVAAALMLAVGCGGCGDRSGDPVVDPIPPNAGFQAVWAEFLTVQEVEDALPLLAAHGLEVNMAWNAPGADPARYALVRTAGAHGVKVNPWLLLTEEDGYWPGSTNAEQFAALARSVMDLWEAEGLLPTTLIVDMEMRIDRARELEAMLEAEGLDIPKFVAFFEAGIDRSQYGVATTTYEALVAEAHQRGWKVLCTTLPNVLDDYADGDDSLRQALGTPIDGIDWDVITFQTYTTLFSNLFAGLIDGKPLTPYMITSYAQTAKEQFGDRAGLDLGLTGTGVSGSPVYPTPAELRADLEAAHAANIPPERINVFSLGGIINRDDPEAWLQPPKADPQTPPEDEATPTIRNLIATLDATN